jgi:hypothetical protein
MAVAGQLYFTFHCLILLNGSANNEIKPFP